MQNQKSEKYKPRDLPELSPEEETFAHEIALGSKQVDAYRKAYGAEGYSLPALKVQACKKAADPRIQEYLASIRAVIDANRNLTLDDAIADEEAFAQRCELAGNYGAAGAAKDRRNKMLGLYVERIELTSGDPMSTLAELEAEFGVEIAQAIAQKYQH